jgi:hypothetical protein
LIFDGEPNATRSELGRTAHKLDEAARGFSFRLDGPLDMRMGGEGPSAADVVAHADERDLARIIATLGEERFARPVARAIVAARSAAPIETTRALKVAIRETGGTAAPLPEFVARTLFAQLFRVGLFHTPAAAIDYIKYPCTVSGKRFIEASGFKPMFTLEETFASVR